MNLDDDFVEAMRACPPATVAIEALWDGVHGRQHTLLEMHAMPAMRRPRQPGQKPRFLQEPSRKVA